MSEMPLIHPKPIEVGDLAPHFSLPSAQGSVVELEQLIHAGAVILWFSPGMV